MTAIPSSTNELYEFDDFRLDVSERILWRGTVRVPLPEKAFDTLVMLLKHSDHLVSKDELLNEVWKNTIVEENNLAKNISLVRKALGVRPSGQEFIETVRGRGFRFSADVRKLPDPLGFNGDSRNIARESTDGKGLRAIPKQPTESHSIARNRPALLDDNRNAVGNKSRYWLVSIAFVSLVGSMFLFSYSSADNRPSDSPITSVAVLPFANPGADPEIEYLSDGISETLIDRLSELSQLKVIARSSSFKYRGENIDLQDAANKLGVQAIITGRVQRRGDDLVIRIELMDARDNKQLWGTEFNRKAADVFAVQQEITQIVSEKLRLKLSDVRGEQFAKTVNPQAYELVLKGRFLQIKGGTENLKKAAQYYQQAIAIDPTYALAHALLSDSYTWLYGPGVFDPKVFTPKAQAAVRKALELDPNLPDAHRVMASLYLNDWNWAAAETEYKRALELNPNLAVARNNYSAYLSIIGRHDEAIAEARRSKELDPLNIHSHVTVAYTLTNARRYDEAIAEFKKIIETDTNTVPFYHWLSFAYSGKGMHREARDTYQAAIRLGGISPSGQIYLGAAYANAGERKKARDILQKLETGKEYVSPGELPVLYIALGQHEKAFGSFEKAYAARDLQLQYLKVDLSFDPVRSDPRFQDLVRRVGLPQ